MDWLDPENWKPIAALADYWKTIVGAAIVIGGAILSFLQWGWAPISRAISKIRDARARRKDRPLRFVLNERQSFWARCRRGSENGTQVSAHWHVTNMSDRNYLLLEARLNGHRCHDVVTLGPAPEQPTHTFGRTFGKNPIQAHEMTELVATFMVFPPIDRDRDDIVADAIFTDNYGDEHRIRSVRFRHVGT
jgi:hypothetical protein